jgi:oligopeptide/dipeptide ABC transporter ATP-binding protein
MRLIDRLCAERDVAAILITHDMGVAAGFCDRIAVMYAGRVVEESLTVDLYDRPKHPYTRGLLSATLDLDAPLDRELPTIPGSPPSPETVDEGCAFRTRCAFAAPQCADPIVLRRFGDRSVACVRAEELPAERSGA